MRIVVTGASGNAGTALLRELSRSGEHDLVGISRRRPPEVAPYDSAKWVSVDIGAADATARLTETFAGADAVVHLAWLIQPSHNRELLRRTNQDGTAAVVEAAINAGVGHLVHQSSVGAYSPGAGRYVDESWPTGGVPRSVYGQDKAAAERIVDRAEGRIPVSRVRPALIFQDEAASEVWRYFLGPFVPKPLVRRRVLRFAPLPNALAFQVVHADDVSAATHLVLQRRATGAFNVAADPVIDRKTFRTVFGGVGPPVPVGVIRALAAVTWHARLQPTEPGWIDLAAQLPLMDCTRLKQLGWSARHTATDVLGSFVDAIGRGAGHPGPLLNSKVGSD